MRKAKLIQREPNGRQSRAGRDKEFPPAQVKRLRDAALAGLRDPEWGTELGRLFLTGILTAEMYAAGKWWREAAARYRTAICAPACDPRAISFEAGRGSASADPDSNVGQEEAAKHRGAVEVFEKANKALINAGKLAEQIVRRLCEHDDPPVGMEQRQHAISGLLVLAEHRGLTGTPKSGQRYVR